MMKKEENSVKNYFGIWIFKIFLYCHGISRAEFLMEEGKDVESIVGAGDVRLRQILSFLGHL